MIKYTLKRDIGIYSNDDFKLCIYWLNGLFDLDDKPNEIDLVISDKPSKNSYFVKKDRRLSFPLSDIEVKLSSGRFIFIGLGVSASYELSKLPDKFYVSVYA